MERRSAKHGPLRDEEMAHETEGLVRGAPQRPHIEQWRETEPVDDAGLAADRPETQAPPSREMALRSELARTLTRDVFPADRDALAEVLADAGSSADLTERVSLLPADRRFASVHEVLETLGISSPETRER
jgi:hypothetical protein